MSGIVVEFEVLPEEGASEKSAIQVCNELSRQLGDPGSALHRSEFGKFAAGASLSHQGSPADVHAVSGQFGVSDDQPMGQFPEDGGRTVFGGAPPGQFGGDSGHIASQSGSRWNQPFEGGNDWQSGGTKALSNAELWDRVSTLEQQLSRTASGNREPEYKRAAGYGQNIENEALEEKCAHLQQRLEAANRDLREAQDAARIDRSRAQRYEQMLKDREQLLVHAKEMWMKESARASKLADALTTAEERLADQEKRLQEVSDRFNEGQAEVRQLRHLLDGPDGGGFGGGFSALPSSYSKLPASTGNLNLSSPTAARSSSVVFAPGPRTQDFEPTAPGSAGGFSTVPGSAVGFSTTDRGVPTVGPANEVPNLPTVPALPPLEAETNSDRFRHLCLTNDAVLYEDDLLQIGLKAEYRGMEGQVAVYFGNKGSAALQAFRVNYFVREENGLRLSVSSLGPQLDAHDQVLQRIGAVCAEPFVEPPLLRIQYLLPDASPRQVQMKFPVVIIKFMQGVDLRQEEFFRVWRSQRFVLNEVTSVVNLTPRLRAALVHIQRSLVFGGALRLHFGFDPNPDNFVLAGRLAQDNRDGEDGVALVRVEVGSGRFAGKARVVVRSSDHAIARGLCECIVLQLTTAHTGGNDR